MAELEGLLAERDRALKVEKRRAKALRRASAELIEETRRERTEREAHQRELSQLRSRMRDVERARLDLEDTVTDLQRRQGDLVNDREVVHSALAAAQDAINALDDQLHAAGRVQRISKFIGNLTFPKGAEDLRTGQPDHPLYETLLEAQQVLKTRWLELIDLRERLGHIQAAVQDRAEGEAFQRAQVAALQEELEDARSRGDLLGRTCREQEESLEQLNALEEEHNERANRIAELEGELEAAQSAMAKTARIARSTTLTLRREEHLRRQEQRDALQALAAAEEQIEELRKEPGE